MKTFDLLVIGEINPDLIVRGADIIPEFNQTEKLVEAAELTIGASSVIMACGAARLGLRVAFIGLVGNDFFGHFMLEQMQSRGIDTSGCVLDDELPTGISIILAHAHDRAILTCPGSIPHLKKEHIRMELFEKASHLHVGGFFLLDDLRSDLPFLFKHARQLGLTTSLDTNWDPQEEWQVADVLPHCDIFFPNENELLRITNSETIESGLTTLVKKVPLVTVKLGAQGAMASRKNEQVFSPALKMDVVDTVGAGDSFDAGFIFGYLRGLPLQKTLDIACACGSLSTRSAGGTTSQPDLDEIRNLSIDI